MKVLTSQLHKNRVTCALLSVPTVYLLYCDSCYKRCSFFACCFAFDLLLLCLFVAVLKPTKRNNLQDKPLGPEYILFCKKKQRNSILLRNYNVKILRVPQQMHQLTSLITKLIFPKLSILHLNLFFEMCKSKCKCINFNEQHFFCNTITFNYEDENNLFYCCFRI